ncbi:LPS assembly lipoprotein LptE, partial [bacterium]|nr:LPS assembly lipoprotein LptE [bacterium]
MSNIIRIWIGTIIYFLWICLTIWGCGLYSFSGSTLPSHIQTVAVPLFEDRTAEFGIDQKVTDSLIDAISNDNTLKISNLGNADSILKGVILQVKDTAGEYDQNEVASDFRVTITVQVSFEDTQKQEILWEETWTKF